MMKDPAWSRWTCRWSLVCAPAFLLGVMRWGVGSVVIAGALAVVLVLATSLDWPLRHAEVASPHLRAALVSTTASLTVVLAAVIACSRVSGALALLVAVALGASSPPAVTSWRHRTQGGGELARTPLEDLCDEWRTTYVRLQRLSDPGSPLGPSRETAIALDLVRRRELLLDELSARRPEEMAAWLRSLPPARSGPEAFVLADPSPE